jgi:hypothetical protein
MLHRKEKFEATGNTPGPRLPTCKLSPGRAPGQTGQGALLGDTLNISIFSHQLQAKPSKLPRTSSTTAHGLKNDTTK